MRIKASNVRFKVSIRPILHDNIFDMCGNMPVLSNSCRKYEFGRIVPDISYSLADLMPRKDSISSGLA